MSKAYKDKMLDAIIRKEQKRINRENRYKVYNTTKKNIKSNTRSTTK